MIAGREPENLYWIDMFPDSLSWEDCLVCSPTSKWNNGRKVVQCFTFQVKTMNSTNFESLYYIYYMKYTYFCSLLSCSPDLVILGEYERVCHPILALQTKISIANKMGWRVWPIDSQRHLSVSKLFSLKSKSNPAVTATTGGVDWLRCCLFTTTNYCFGKNGHLCSQGIDGVTPQVVVWCWQSQRA